MMLLTGIAFIIVLGMTCWHVGYDKGFEDRGEREVLDAKS
jgi:hypothetical protein